MLADFVFKDFYMEGFFFIVFTIFREREMIFFLISLHSINDGLSSVGFYIKNFFIFVKIHFPSFTTVFHYKLISIILFGSIE